MPRIGQKDLHRGGTETRIAVHLDGSLQYLESGPDRLPFTILGAACTSPVAPRGGFVFQAIRGGIG